jgi:hypothetical protein
MSGAVARAVLRLWRRVKHAIASVPVQRWCAEIISLAHPGARSEEQLMVSPDVVTRRAICGRTAWRPFMSDIVVPRWIVLVGTIVVLLGLALFLGSLVFGYVADEYFNPALSEQSVPPSRGY